MHFSSLLTLGAAVCFVASVSALDITQVAGRSSSVLTTPQSVQSMKRGEVTIEPMSAPPPASKRASTIMRRLNSDAVVVSSEMATKKIVSTAGSAVNSDLQQLQSTSKRASKTMRRAIVKRLAPDAVIASTSMASDKVLKTAESALSTDLNQVLPNKAAPATTPANKINTTGLSSQGPSVAPPQ